MIVYGSSISPFVRKVLAFGAEKGIELENQPVGIGSDDPGFLEASPFRKMPAFRDGDFTVCDSTAIITYLEALHPEPNLIPIEPKARARAIWFEEFADTIMAACMRDMFFNRIVAPVFLGRAGDLEAADRAERELLPPVLDYLEGQVSDSGFLVEDRITLADIAVASPFVNITRHLGIAIDADRWPKARAYAEAILARPSFAEWIEKEQRFFEKVRAQPAMA